MPHKATRTNQNRLNTKHDARRMHLLRPTAHHC